MRKIQAKRIVVLGIGLLTLAGATGMAQAAPGGRGWGNRWDDRRDRWEDRRNDRWDRRDNRRDECRDDRRDECRDDRRDNRRDRDRHDKHHHHGGYRR